MLKTTDKEEAAPVEWRRIELDGCDLDLSPEQYDFVDRYARMWHTGDLQAAVRELAQKPE